MPLTVTVLVPSWLASSYAQHPTTWLRVIGVGVIAASLGLFVWTQTLFIRVGRGTLAPWDATTELVAVGPYRYVRNPMISAVLGVLLGEAALLGSVPILVWAGVFYVVNTVYFVVSEEPGLLRRFGPSYDDYKKHVRRWLPRLRPYSAADFHSR